MNEQATGMRETVRAWVKTGKTVMGHKYPRVTPDAEVERQAHQEEKRETFEKSERHLEDDRMEDDRTSLVSKTILRYRFLDLRARRRAGGTFRLGNPHAVS